MLFLIYPAQILPRVEASPEEPQLAASTVNPIAPVRSLANWAASPPRESALMAHFRATGSLRSIDLSSPEDRAQALETADEWFYNRNIPLELLKVWRSFDVEIDSKDPIESAKFRKESAIRKQCFKVSRAGSHLTLSVPLACKKKRIKKKNYSFFCSLATHSDLGYHGEDSRPSTQDSSRSYAQTWLEKVSSNTSRSRQTAKAG